jgi:hypothetical protein
VSNLSYFYIYKKNTGPIEWAWLFVGPCMLLVGGVRHDPFLYFIFFWFSCTQNTITRFIYVFGLDIVFKYYFKFLFEFNNLFFNYYVYDTKIIMLIINCSWKFNFFLKKNKLNRFWTWFYYIYVFYSFQSENMKIIF